MLSIGYTTSTRSAPRVNCLAEFIAFILRVGVVYPAYTILANHIHCTNIP